jgi:uncharacterized OB-fold protein
MTDERRPLPPLGDPDTRAFWEATRQGRLVYQVCDRCGRIVFHPRLHCPHCGSLELKTRESAGRGTVYSYTVIRQHGHPFFGTRLPYVVALIDVDEGFRMLSEVVAEPDAVRVGQRVRLDWEDQGQIRIPLFRTVD